MPRVPQYDRNQERNQPMPTPYASSAEVDVGLWAVNLQRATGETARMLADIKQREKQKTDLAALTKARTALMQYHDDAQYGENGFQRLRGAAVIDGDPLQGVMDAEEQKYKEIVEGLTEDQRETFDREIASTRQGFRRDSLRHFTSESDAHNLKVLEDDLKSTHDTALHRVTDEMDIVETMEHMERQLTEFNDANGWWNQEQLSQRVVKARSAFLRELILKLSDTDPATAKDLLSDTEEFTDKHGPVLLEEDAKRVRGIVEDAGTLKTAQGTVDRIMGDIPSNYTADQLEQAYAEARLLEGPEREKALTMLDANFQRLNRVENIRQAEIYDEGLPYIEGDGKYESIPARLLERADAQTKKAWKQEADAIAYQKPIETDMDAYEEFWTMAELEPEKLAEMDPKEFFREYRSKIAKTHLIQMHNFMRALWNAGEDSDPVRSSQTFNAMINTRAEVLRFTTKEEAARFRMEAFNREAAAKRANGNKDLSEDDYNKILDDMTRTAFIRGGRLSRDRETYVGLLPTMDESKGEAYIPKSEIDEATWDDLEAFAAKHNTGTGKANIEELYADALADAKHPYWQWSRDERVSQEVQRKRNQERAAALIDAGDIEVIPGKIVVPVEHIRHTVEIYGDDVTEQTVIRTWLNLLAREHFGLDRTATPQEMITVLANNGMTARQARSLVGIQAGQ